MLDSQFSVFRKGLLILLVVSGLPGCSEHAERRVRSTFEIPLSQPLNEENIKAAVIKKIPIGTSEKQVYLKLKELGVGSDKLSSFNRVGKEGRIVVRFEYDPHEFGFVKKHYGVLMELNENRMLKDVVVHRWLTGL